MKAKQLKLEARSWFSKYIEDYQDEDSRPK